MLQGTEPRRLVPGVRGSLVGLVAAAAVLLVTAARPDAPADAPEPPFELGYLPTKARGFVAVRPALCFRQPGMDIHSRLIDRGFETLKALGIKLPADLRPENIEQIVADVHLSSAGTGKPNSRNLMMGGSSLVIRMNRAFDWVEAVRGLAKDLKRFVGKEDGDKELSLQETSEDGVTVYALGPMPILGPGAVYFSVPDRRTIVFHAPGPRNATAESCRTLLRDVDTARKRDWGTGIAAMNGAAIAVVLDNHDAHYAGVFAKDLDEESLGLLRQTSFLSGGIELGDRRPVRAVVEGTSAEAGAKLETAAKNLLKVARESLKDAKGVDAEPMIAFQTAVMGELLQSAELRRDGARLDLMGYSARRFNEFIAVCVTAANQADAPAEGAKR